jgi:hypothetical protein
VPANTSRSGIHNRSAERFAPHAALGTLRASGLIIGAAAIAGVATGCPPRAATADARASFARQLLPEPTARRS